MRIRYVGRLIAAERAIGVLRFLRSALGACRFLGLCVGGFDVSFFLELGDEFLHNLDFEVLQQIYPVSLGVEPSTTYLR